MLFSHYFRCTLLLPLSGFTLPLVISICLFTVFGPATAQHSEIASTGKFLVNFDPVDTSLVMDFVAKGKEFQYSHPDSAMQLFEKAYKLSVKKYFNDGAVLGLFGMAYTAAGKGDIEQGIEYCKRAYPFCQKPNFLEFLPSTWFVNMGILNVYQGRYAVAAKYFNDGLVEANRCKLPENHGNYLSIFNNLSAVYVRMDQPATALKYLTQAEDISRRYQLHEALAFTLCNKGHAFMLLKKYNVAYKHFKEGLVIAKSNAYKEVEHALNCDMGKLLLEMHRPEEAVKYLRVARKIDSDSNPFYSSILPGYNLAQAYYQLKEYAEAEKHMLQTLQLAEEMGFTDGQVDAHKTLSAIYEAQGKYRLALTQERVYSEMKEELLSKEQAKDINELEIKYNSAQKDQELTKTQLQIAQQQVKLQEKNTWISIFALVILLVAGGSFLIYLNNRNKQNILTGRINLLEKDQQIKLLKASIDGEEQERMRIGRELHDGIGGLLSAVKLQFGALRLKHQLITREEDFIRAISLVDEVTGEVRKTAHNLMPEVLVKGGLEESIRNFCERISSDETELKVQVYGEIPRLLPTSELSIYRIVQELLNNILKHAKASEAIVQLNWQKHIFHISVEDNGRGMSEEKSHGIGLKNIAARVEAMGGNIEIESALNVGTCIYLEFATSRLELSQETIPV